MAGVLLGNYLTLTLKPGGLVVPSSLALVSILVLSLAVWSRVQWSDAAYGLAMLSVAILATLLSDSMALPIMEALKSALMISASLFSFMILMTLRKLPVEGLLYKYLSYGIVIVLVGSVLEILTPLRLISDAFRSFVYHGSFVYEALSRDIALHGGYRPSFFTQEPSHVARFLALALLGTYLLRPGWRSATITCAGFGMALLVTRSPTLLAVPIVGYFALAHLLEVRADLDRLTRVLFRTIVVVLVPLILYVAEAAGSHGILPLRLADILAGRDGSMYVRFHAPFQIALDAITTSPAVGFGLVGKEVAAGNFINVLAQYPSLNVWVFIAVAPDAYGNAMIEIPIYFGLLGGVLFLMGLYMYLADISGGAAFYLFSVFCGMSLFDQGISAPRAWLTAGTLLLCYLVYARHLEQRRAHSPLRLTKAAATSEC